MFFGDVEVLHVLGGDVDSVAFEDVASDVLPEVDELECGADFVGEGLAVGVAVAAHVEDDSSDGVGGFGAVVEELVEGLIAGEGLVLFEGLDEIVEGFDGDVVALDGLAESGEDGGGIFDFRFSIFD